MSAEERALFPEKDGTLWVHGLPARSFQQVAGYLTGDAHDQSKVQIYVAGRFYDVVIHEPLGTPQPFRMIAVDKA